MPLDISIITDTQAEAALLATVIRHPEFMYNVSYMRPEYFYDVVNGCLYWSVQQITSQGIDNIDALNLSNTINSNNAIKKKIENYNITNIQEFIDLSQYAARNTLEEYKNLVNRVVTLAFKRSLSKTALEIQQGCFNDDFDLNGLNDFVNDKIGGVSTKFVIGSQSQMFGEKVRGIWQEIIEDRNPDGTVGLPSVISIFNDYFTFQSGDLICLTARMKMGKSLIFTAECVHKAIYNNIPTLYLDTEINDKLWTKRIIASISGVDIQKVEKGGTTPEEDYRIEQAIIKLENAPLVHEYLPDGFNQAKIEALCKQWKQKMNLQFVIYDYMKWDSEAGASEVSNVLGKICDFMKNKIAGGLDVAVFTGAQLNRANEVSSSDKIEMYCSTSIRWRKKTNEELSKYPVDNGYGNYVAEIPINRIGPQTDEGQVLEVKMDGAHMRVATAQKQRHVEEENPFGEE